MFASPAFRLAPLLLVAPALALGTGCGGKKTDLDQFKERLQKVESRETDKLDCRGLPKVGDAEMQLLAASPEVGSLRELILDGTEVSDSGVRGLPPMPHLATFAASKTRVTDESVALVGRWGNLETLRLDQSRITDAGLKSVAEIKTLRHLSLWRCPVTDEGVAHLKSLPKLETLSLDETAVTDAALAHLAPPATLKSLSLWKTKVTPEAAEELRKQRPGLKVNR